MAYTAGRFGTVPITLIRRTGDTPADWQPDVKTVEFHFVGGNNNETQFIGRGLMKLEAMVRLESAADFEVFIALAGTAQTLRMDYHGTVYRGDASGETPDGAYKDFHNVMLTAPSNIVGRFGGQVTLDVTFTRGVPA